MRHQLGALTALHKNFPWCVVLVEVVVVEGLLVFRTIAAGFDEPDEDEACHGEPPWLGWRHGSTPSRGSSGGFAYDWASPMQPTSIVAVPLAPQTRGSTSG